MPLILQDGGNLVLQDGGNLALQGEGESSGISNWFTRAFGTLLDAQATSLEDEPVVQIGAVTGIPAVIREVPRDEVFVPGGRAQAQSSEWRILAQSWSGT